MTAPNVNTLWGRTLIESLAAAGVDGLCLSPGSRSTPLTVAAVEQAGVRTFSHLDERAGGFFALGRGKASGVPTPLVCTSGTAAAEFHPAVIEADRARVPMLVLTADRPPELQESGANQTVDQDGLYGSAVQWDRTLPEPAADDRKLRDLRATVARAVRVAMTPPCGPIHLNVPFRKPLSPTESTGDLDVGSVGAIGPVTTHGGTTVPDEGTMASLAAAIDAADRPLIVVGPTDRTAADALAGLSAGIDAPLLADPLSGLRFGDHPPEATICGGYDGYLQPAVTDGWPEPDLVIRFGAAPTSARLQDYLERVGGPQYLVDPAGQWRDPRFVTTDLVVADPAALAERLAARTSSAGPTDWPRRFAGMERAYWSLLDDLDSPAEAAVVEAVLRNPPDPGVLFVSNSMPVRDLDRFGRPRSADLRVLGNRGASGIDGITSTALGAASATDAPLVLLLGDLAFYHDLNGLLAIQRCDVEATIILINNDGGGIFHALPIAAHETFEAHFKTPHGLDFSSAGELFDVPYDRVQSPDAFEKVYRRSRRDDGSRIIEIETDGARSHTDREALSDRVVEALEA